jgi:hypothetical protein
MNHGISSVLLKLQLFVPKTKFGENSELRRISMIILAISKSRKIKRYRKIPNNCGDSQQKEALNFEKNKKKNFPNFFKTFSF